MAQNVLFNGTIYQIPDVGDDNYGQNLTDYFVAIPVGALQKSGGNFTLTADVNFGATYGPIAAYFKSRTANISTAGALRLAKTDTVSWRNNANDGNLALAVDSSNRLTFNGAILETAAALTQGSVPFAGADGSLTQDNARFFWDATNHWLGLGTSTPAGPLHISGASVQQFIDSYGSTVSVRGRRAEGTKASPTATALNSSLLSLAGAGYETTGNAFTSARGSFNIFAAEAFTNSAQGTYLTFRATPIGGTSTAEVASLTGAGVLRVNAMTTAGPVSVDSSGNFSSAATLGALYGGTGLNTSASTGLAKVSGGTWSVATLVNADVNASAAIAYGKLALTGSILNADLAGSIAYSKLVLTGAILNADLAGSIAYSKLVLTGAILNADLAGSIAASKLVGSDIATVGTITSGTWSATAISAAKGGTAIDTSASTGIPSIAAGTWSVGTLTGDVTSVARVTTVAKIAGTTVSGTTGSGNVVFSASPTFTGTLLGAAATLSGAFTPTGGIVGDTSGSAIGAGKIGEYLTDFHAVSTATTGQTTIATITLTTGVWSCSAQTMNDNVATQTGYTASLVIKGSGGSTAGDDQLTIRPGAGGSGSLTFCAREVVVASGDATKTFLVQAQSSTLAQTIYGRVTAIRVA